MSTFSCVLFDLEGTLVDFQWRLAEAEAALRAALEPLGYPPALFEGENYAGIRRRARALAASDGGRREVDRLLGPVYDRYDLDAQGRWSLRPGAPEVISSLRSRGRGVALVTNIGRRAVSRALASFDIASAFGAVITRDDVAEMKPDGEGIRRAVEILGGEAGSALMVGDSLSDLGAARAAGVRVAIVAGGESPAEEVTRAGPDYFLPDLRPVPDLT